MEHLIILLLTFAYVVSVTTTRNWIDNLGKVDQEYSDPADYLK
jgi:hypothetical protein